MGIVSRATFDDVVKELSKPHEFGFDTETTGLNPYLGDRLFCFALTTADKTYFFNFQSYDGLEQSYVLDRRWLKKMLPIFINPESSFHIANAKFDLHIMAVDGINIKGKVYDSEIAGRILKNDRLKIGIDALAKEISLQKSDAVKEFISKNKLYEWENIPGKKKRVKKPFYNQVPFDIMSTYCQSDTELVFNVAQYQKEKLARLRRKIPEDKVRKKFDTLLDTERRLTKIFFRMEQIGIKVDRDYCNKAIPYEDERLVKYAAEFESICGIEFKDSNLVLKQAFDSLGIEVLRNPITEKMREKAIKTGIPATGNPCFKDDVLEKVDSPLAKCVQNYRDAYKRVNSYFRNFMYFADSNDIVHCNIRQCGTASGRISVTDPALQTLSKEEDESSPYPIRRAIVPHDEDHFFVMIDYDQMEFKMMLDYAGETEVIKKVLDGMDLHLATAEQMGVKDRKISKTISFLLLYGGGPEVLAHKLKVNVRQAKQLQALYFGKLPRVSRFIKKVKDRARFRHFIYNWTGRVYQFDRTTYYKAPNYLIQGGCADVVKRALVEIDDYLKDKRSKQILQIHDEILFLAHKDELDVWEHVRYIMENTYPHKFLPLTCSVEHSYRSWADKKKGFPTDEKTGNSIQRTHLPQTSGTSEMLG